MKSHFDTLSVHNTTKLTKEGNCVQNNIRQIGELDALEFSFFS